VAIALTVAGANACDYCASPHAAILAGLKVAPAAINAHLAGQSNDPRTAAILRLAKVIVASRGMVADNDISAALAAGLTEAEIVEIMAQVVANILRHFGWPLRETRATMPTLVGHCRKDRAAFGCLHKDRCPQSELSRRQWKGDRTTPPTSDARQTRDNICVRQGATCIFAPRHRNLDDSRPVVYQPNIGATRRRGSSADSDLAVAN
jgi:AhpD family alkylhydroperoxidase